MNRALSCRNALLKHMSVHENYSGIVSGISHKICVATGYWPQNKGLLILSFQTMREAELWKDSVPEIRQQDWLDGVDMIIVPVRLIPPSHKRFIELQDLRFEDIGGFMGAVSAEVEKAEEQTAACRCVVSTPCVRIVKGLWNPHHLVMNFWPNEEEYCKGSEQLKKIMCCNCEWADVHSVAFCLFPLTEPICGSCG